MLSCGKKLRLSRLSIVTPILNSSIRKKNNILAIHQISHPDGSAVSSPFEVEKMIISHFQSFLGSPSVVLSDLALLAFIPSLVLPTEASPLCCPLSWKRSTRVFSRLAKKVGVDSTDLTVIFIGVLGRSFVRTSLSQFILSFLAPRFKRVGRQSISTSPKVVKIYYVLSDRMHQ